MKGIEFRAIRKRLGLSKNQFAGQLGYTGNSHNNTTQIERFERDRKQIPLYIARLAWLMDQVITARVPRTNDEMIDWPQWEGYEFDGEGRE